MGNDDGLKLESQLCFPLYAATRAMMQAYQPFLAELRLTYPQYLVMIVLWEEDGISVKQLGDKLYLDSGTLTPLLKRLEGAGLVTRERSTKDERVVLLFLTAEGKKLKKRASSIPWALFCRIALPEDEFVRLRSEMKRLYTTLRTLNESEKRKDEEE